MSELAVGSLKGLAANSFVIDVASGSKIVQPGSILQVVNATTNTEVTTASNVFSDTTLQATITPTSATSKILVAVVNNGVGKFTGNTYAGFRLLRDATVISNYEGITGATNDTSQVFIGSVSFNFLDSPSTTSAITYKTQFRSVLNLASVRVHLDSFGSIVLMEVAG
jgi:hypothetical protein